MRDYNVIVKKIGKGEGCTFPEVTGTEHRIGITDSLVT